VATKKARPKPPATANRFRRRQIELASGVKLVLHGNGSITQVDGAGETTAQWAVDDPDWPHYAIRFGLQPQPTTVVPESRREAAPRPD
jgi:hypothetical protein